MNFSSINEVWKTPESLEHMQHPAHVRQKKIIEERKRMNEYSQRMAHEVPKYPWTSEPKDRYINGYFSRPDPVYKEHWDAPWGSPMRYWPEQRHDREKIKKAGPGMLGKYFEGFEGSNQGCPDMYRNIIMVFFCFMFGVIAILMIVIIQLLHTIKKLNDK